MQQGFADSGGLGIDEKGVIAAHAWDYVLSPMLADPPSSPLIARPGEYARRRRWFPVSGYDPSPDVVARFLALPVIVGVASAFGRQSSRLR